jgi:hypothetical protein
MKKNLLFITEKLSKTFFLFSVILFISFGMKAGKLPVVGSLTLSTTSSAPANIIQGSGNQVIYNFQMNVTSAFQLERIKVKTLGTYVAGDVQSFSLFMNSTNSMTGATQQGTNFSAPTGSGQIVELYGYNPNIPIGTTYFFVIVNLKTNATNGNTIKVDGSTNPLTVIGISTNPTVTDNQTDVFGVRTIKAPAITLSTTTSAPANIIQGSPNQIIYNFQMNVADAFQLERIKVKTLGTYVASDIQTFSLWMNTTNSFAGATQQGALYTTITGNGQTIELAGYNPNIPVGTTYFFVTANLKSAAIDGNTIKIDGSTNPITVVGLTTTPTVTNNQTDVFSVRTIKAPAITLSTTTSAPANIIQGSPNQIIYNFQMNVADAFQLERIKVKTLGTYVASDIQTFSLWMNTTNSFAGATQQGALYTTITGNGQTIELAGYNPNIPVGTTYFFVTANLKSAAIDGNTIKIDGSTNPITVVGLTTTPTVTNNQTDVFSVRTIKAPAITLSTTTSAPANIIQGSPNQIIYNFQMNVADAFQLERIKVKTLGTYVASDIQTFSLWMNTTNSFAGATQQGALYTTITGNGQTIELAGYNPNIPVGTTYFFVTANLKSAAIDGNTIKIDGSTNPITVVGYSTTPTVINNQTDIFGVRTIKAPAITLSTINLPPSNIIQGNTKKIIYNFKMDVADEFTLERIKVKTAGSYIDTDILTFYLWTNTSNTLTGALISGVAATSPSGSGQIIELYGYNPIIPVGTTYFFVTPNITAGAINGNTLKVDGSANPITVVGYSTTPTVTNNQTDIAGKQTIGTPLFTYTTESSTAKIIAKGTANHPFYTLKVVGGSVGGTITNLAIQTAGTYNGSDIGSFTLYKNSTPSITGATLVATDNTSTGSGETLTFPTGYVEIDAGTTTYLIVRANINSTATSGNTFYINGSANPITTTNSGLVATITNSQTNVAGIQTIGVPPSFTSVISNVAANTTANLCTAVVNYTPTTAGSPTPTLSYTFTGATTGSGSGSGSGAVFNKGITNVVITATNGCLPDATQSFTVIISDVQLPTITAPANVSATTNTACTATGVVLGTPITADNCSVASTTNNAPTAFLLGVTTVTWTVTDGSGNIKTANQTVTVTDNILPTITAPANVTATTNTACTATGVILGTPTTADNCSVASTTNNAPTAFPLGLTTVTWTVTDGSGNIKTANQTVTVTDNVLPTITAPANVTATTNTACTATGVVLGLPATSDNCSVASTTNNAPTAFPIGVTTVIWTVTDGAGNVKTANQTITVTDNILPTITPPANVNATTNTACTATEVVLGTPTTADNCGVASTTNNAPTAFPLGVTTVIWTVTDGSGNIKTANQTVTVTDNVLPTITAPANVIATGCTSATGVALGTPTTADNCTVASVTNNAPTTFPAGATTVTWTVTDGAGNIKTATQTVTVVDNVLPTITAPANVSATTNTTCTATEVALGTPTTADNCSVASVTNNAPTAFPLGITTVIWTVTDGAGNIKTANQTVTVTDNVLPSITAPANVSATTNIACTATGVVLGTPTTSDNCSVASTINNAPTAFPLGVTTVIWTVTDGAGNTKTATQTVTVTDNVLPTITAPANVNATTNTACTATGVVLGSPITADNCSVASTTNNAPTIFPLGITTVVWTVTDDAGNIKTANQTVTVTDNVLPTITAPANVTATISSGCTVTGVVLGTPTTSDNCSVATTTNNAPTAFPVGVTTVIWTVTDGAGNTKTAIQTVTVTDNILPTISAPANVNATANTTCIATGVVLGTPITADNCSIASTTNNAPTAFPLGITTVVWTVTDGSGNIKTASQTVTVTDNILPTITAPTNVTAIINTACTATGVVLGTPTTSDNCSVASTTNNAPTAFPLGVTTVIWTVTDGAGNITTANQTVTVTDNVLPTITAPSNVTAIINTACTATGVVLGTPTTSDNCSVASTTNNAPTAFPIGVTTVIWTVIDGAGNTKTANQTVTITDNILPTITTPANINAATNTACTATGVVLGTPTTADNCSVASTTNNAPTAFPLGVTTVTWTVTDGSGNIKTATQTVTVTDNILPTITAPANVSATTNTACTATGVVLGTPITSDNCSVASTTNNAPTTFPIGSTTVIWTVTDAAGNVKTANQTVTVTSSGGSGSIVISTQSGDWNTPSTWQCGDMPSATKMVQVQSGHIVDINTDVHAKDVKLIGTGKINYVGTAGKLFLNQ